MFGFAKKEKANEKSPTERYLEMRDELDEYKRKEKEWEREKKKNENGIGVILEHQYLSLIIEYILTQKVEAITLVTTVEYFKDKEEDYSEDDFPTQGIWYGVNVMDREKEITKILTLLENDTCFVSQVASKRRRKHLFLATKIAEYIKVAIENERMVDSILKEVEIKEEIKVAKALFNPDDKENVIGFQKDIERE